MLCPRGDQTESPFRARSMLQRMHSKQASTSVVNTLFSQKNSQLCLTENSVCLKAGMAAFT